MSVIGEQTPRAASRPGSAPSSPERRFAEHLMGLADRKDRADPRAVAALAALRRGLGKEPGEAAEVHRYVVPWLPAGVGRRREDAYYLVASLFAWHQRSWTGPDSDAGPTNLGASLRRLADGSQGDSVERRFVALLNSHAEELAAHLRQIVGLLKTKEVPIDWARLLRDIQDWERGDRRVQRDWARAFWGRTRATEPPDEAGRSADPTAGADPQA